MNPDLSNLSDPIVVSGLGLVSPLGNTVDETWRAILSGKVGYAKENEIYIGRVRLENEVHSLDRGTQFALNAVRQALDHAGLINQYQNFKIACSVSQSKPVVVSAKQGLDEKKLLSSFFSLSFPDVIRDHYALSGPTLNVVAACATGIVSMMVGIQWLLSGEVDVVLAGASESSLNTFYQTGFLNLGVLATGDDVRHVCPFDKARSGFAMAEGAAVMVLERASHAKKRHHKPLAKIAALHMQQSQQDSLRFDSDGTAVATLIKSCVRTTSCDEVIYINAHGTGTVANDLAEANGIQKAFGRASKNVLVSSTKSMTGHLLGAAGALEAVLSILALINSNAPHTQHLEDIDDCFDLNFVMRDARPVAMSKALSLSYGFGGQMGAVVFEKFYE